MSDDLPGQLSLATKRHCTISMGPFDVIISYKCCKDALSGRKLVTELFRADLVTFFLLYKNWYCIFFLSFIFVESREIKDSPPEKVLWSLRRSLSKDWKIDLEGKLRLVRLKMVRFTRICKNTGEKFDERKLENNYRDKYVKTRITKILYFLFSEVDRSCSPSSGSSSSSWLLRRISGQTGGRQSTRSNFSPRFSN